MPKLHTTLTIVAIFVFALNLNGMDLAINQVQQQDLKEKFFQILFDKIEKSIHVFTTYKDGHEMVMDYINTKKIPASLRIFHGCGKMSQHTPDYYLNRIRRYMQCSPEAFVLAFLYIRRIINKTHIMPAFNNISFHRMFLAAIVVAAKFNDDRLFGQNFYAKMGGISTMDLDDLELTFLFTIKFDLNISVEEWKCLVAELNFDLSKFIPSQTLPGENLDLKYYKIFKNEDSICCKTF